MFYDNLLILLRFRNILADNCIGTKPKGQAYYKTNGNLSYYLIDAFQSILVLTENLDIIVHKTKEPKPDGSYNHQQQVDVTHTSQQQYRY